MAIIKQKVQMIVFDWGNTLMRDFPEKQGPMFEWDVVEKMADVDFLLDYLSKKYSIVVATNAGASDTAAMMKALNRVGLDHFFTQAFSSKDLGVSKPNPAFFYEISDKMGISCQNTLMIGNDFEKDIIGALNAGMQAIWYNHEGNPFPEKIDSSHFCEVKFLKKVIEWL